MAWAANKIQIASHLSVPQIIYVRNSLYSVIIHSKDGIVREHNVITILIASLLNAKMELAQERMNLKMMMQME